jgi:F0F1-type ATP synthase assembly protein I
LVSGVIVGCGIGYMLNEIFDFGSIFLISSTILGGMAGILNVSRYLKQMQQEDREKGVKNG